MRLIDVSVLKEWVKNWFAKNRYYHPYAKNNNIPITELYDILEQMPSAQPEILACGEGELISNPDVPDTNAGDLISRRATIDLLRKRLIETANNNVGFTCDAGQVFEDASERIRYWIDELPSAQPERKTGKWIKLDAHAHLADHKCSACGQECYVPTCMGDPMYDFCPNCGAKMLKEGEQND